VQQIVTLFSAVFLLLAPVLGGMTCRTYDTELAIDSQKFIFLEDQTGEKIALENSFCATTEDGDSSEHDHTPSGFCSYCLISGGYSSLGGSYLDLGLYPCLQIPTIDYYQDKPKYLPLYISNARAPPNLLWA
jgi:hypothetical protein